MFRKNATIIRLNIAPVFALALILLLVASCAPVFNSPGPNPNTKQGAGAEADIPKLPAETSAASTAKSVSAPAVAPVSSAYPIVDTSQGKCYDNNAEIPCSQNNFTGQDAQYTGNAPHYQDNGDGTMTDLVTGLMWQQDPGAKMTYAQAVAGADSFSLAGYDDWRLPTIKELYSLILFDGTDVAACPKGNTCSSIPFIDTRYFKFSYGSASAGERTIDSQWATSTKYVSTTMNGNATMFGVNFADGRIKGYPTDPMRGQSQGKLFYVIYVRGNPNYGKNILSDNGNGTITDSATSLTWMQADSAKGMDWQTALNYCENLDYAGSNDWRLPNIKELQSIVDYTRSPATSNSAAIDPLFSVTSITDEAGQNDYPFYWSSTTHADSQGRDGFANYVAFGRALGYMNNTWMDVHGAGAQRSDPKSGNASDHPIGKGPQGDSIRIQNYARCVRGGNATFTVSGAASETRPSMQTTSTGDMPIQQGNQAGGMPGQNNSQPGGPMGRTPPQEAINACTASTQGASCSFTAPMGTITGTCQTIQQQMACVPAQHP